MKDECYLIVDAYGVVRLTKREPKLSRTEVAIKLRVAVSDNAFRSPIIGADLTVEEGRVIQPSIEVDAVEENPA